MSFEQKGQTLFTAPIDASNTAYLAGTVIPPQSVLVSASSTLPLDESLWHRRFAHFHHAGLRKAISEGLVTGLKLQSTSAADPICEPCLSGKLNAAPFPLTDSRETRPLALVHSDVHGPLPVRSPSGYRYWSTFIDDASQFKVVIPMKSKDELFACFKQFKAYAEAHLGVKLAALQDDKGGEYMSNAMEEFCLAEGVARRHTVRNRPQQNGVAERFNRVLSEGITSMLAEAGLPPQFWAEALSSLVHVQNRTPTSAMPHTTPHAVWYKSKPDVSHLRVWGCLAYVHVQKDKRGQLGSHMEKCVFIGYPAGYKGWKFYNPVTKQAVISERAVFDERYFPGLKNWTSVPANHSHPPTESFPGTLVDAADDPDDPELPEARLEGEIQPVVQANLQPPPAPPVVSSPSPSPSVAAPSPSPAPEPALRRSGRVRRPPGEWWKVQPTAVDSDSDSEEEVDSQLDPDGEDDEAANKAQSGVSEANPRTLKQALRLPDSAKWKEAAQVEIDAHIHNNTWTPSSLPPGKRAIPCRWVLTKKFKADGSLERFKGRLVAKGFHQRPGFDYLETFAPTVRMASIRTVLALSAIEDLDLRSVDISHAFVNGELEEEIYMEQPETFHFGKPGDVLRLNKSLYGLKQAGRVWSKKLHTALTQLGFQQLKSDASLYIYSRDSLRIMVPVFIDDITIASPSSAASDRFVQELAQHFELRDLGPTSWLLGIQVARDRSKRTLSLSQRQYIVDMLDTYGFADCSPVQTPMLPGTHFTAADSPSTPEQHAEMQSVPYINSVGALMYLAVSTRPDIAYTVSKLARFNSNPGKTHWAAVKHLFRYLKGTMDLKLTYGPNRSPSAELFSTFSDADYGMDIDSGRSTGGYMVRIGSGAVNWSSKLQPVVSLSTTEAEYIAAVEAGKEVAWMRNLLTELGYSFTSPSTPHMDNNSAIQVCKNPEHFTRLKHMNLRLYWLRDAVQDGLLKPEFCPTAEMAADLLTKALPPVKVKYLHSMMGLC